jgi:hypothetical protein
MYHVVAVVVFAVSIYGLYGLYRESVQAAD